MSDYTVKKTDKKASELTRSPFWKEVYRLQESAANRPSAACLENRLDNLETDLQTLCDETRDKFDGLPDNFKTSEVEEKCDGRMDALEAAIETIENIDHELTGTPEEQQRQTDELWQEAIDALNGIQCD